MKQVITLGIALMLLGSYLIYSDTPKTLTAEAEVIPTNIPLPTATAIPEMESITFDPELIAQGMGKGLQPEDIQFKTLNERIEYELITGDLSSDTAQMLASGNTQYANDSVVAPVISKIGPPCLPGYEFRLTGYNFYEPTSYGTHRAVDGRCFIPGTETRDNKLGSPINGVVHALVDLTGTSPGESGFWYSNGFTMVLKAEMNGCDLYVPIGHLVVGSALVTIGQTVHEGQHIGTIGESGTNVEGIHAHIPIILVCNGQRQYIDPETTGLMGVRSK